jgi:hypothetical protein
MRNALTCALFVLAPLLAGCATSEADRADARGSAARAPIEAGTRTTRAIAPSPLSLDDLERLKSTVLLGEKDIRWLRASRSVLEPQVEQVLDVWYGFVGSHPHLLASFSNARGEPQTEYLAAVRKRFGQWVLDTADARFDQAWLDHQHEIGLRHHRTKKNATDGADAAGEVPFRYLVALHQPITATLRPFLEKSGRPAAEIDAMQDAWRKAVLLTVILWSQPYVRAGSF